MESPKDKVRYKLLIAKCQVTKVSRGDLGCKFSVALPQGIILEADLAFAADVRVGDILSLYTEIFAHAQPTSSSIQ